MKGLKIKPIRKICDVKAVFAFFKRTYFSLAQTENNVFLPLHETYEGMIENLDRKEKLQFFAELGGEVVGCLIAIPSNETPNTLYIPVVAVEANLRSSGVASELFTALQTSLKKCHYTMMRIPAVEGSAAFFKKRGFILRLQVKAYPPHTTEDIRRANKSGLEAIEDIAGKIKVRFAVPSFDEKLAMPFIRELGKVKIEYIFEKKI